MLRSVEPADFRRRLLAYVEIRLLDARGQDACILYGHMAYVGKVVLHARSGREDEIAALQEAVQVKGHDSVQLTDSLCIAAGVLFISGVVGEHQRDMELAGQMRCRPSDEHGVVHMDDVERLSAEFPFYPYVKGVGEDDSPDEVFHAGGVAEYVRLFPGIPLFHFPLFLICRREDRHFVPQRLQSPGQPFYGDGHAAHDRLVVVCH